MSKVISINCQKGGVGKSTIAVNLAGALAEAGHKTVLIDTDPQTTASLLLNATAENNLFDVLGEKTAIVNAIVRHNDFLDVLIGSIDLSEDSAQTLAPKLQDVIKALRGKYDFIIIDNAPAVSSMGVFSMAFSDAVIIPVISDLANELGMIQQMRTLDRLIARGYITAQQLHILFNKYHSNYKREKGFYSECIERYGSQVMQSTIRQCKAISNAADYGKTIIEYDPNSNGASDFAEVAKEVMSWN